MLLCLCIMLLVISHFALFLDYSNPLYPRHFTFHDVVCIQDVCGIDVFIVDSMPMNCQGTRGLVMGCAVYSGPIKIIYLKTNYIQDRDQYGLTTFEHEALHILCECDFHSNESLRNLVINAEDPYKFVLENKVLIRTGKSFNNFLVLG